MSVCQDSLAQYIAAFASYATSTFFLYEYLITLSAEVELFWKSGFTRTSAVFFTNRYLALAFHFLPIWLPHRLGICKGESLFLLILGLMQYPVWAAFSAMRAYSVSAETGWTQVLLPVLVFILVCVPAGINIPRIVWTGAVVQVACGCVMAAQHIPENFNVLYVSMSRRHSSSS
ncbi:hypothetical protein C8Q76DRAFT_300502 [Earliella scabrosa]|nr:hypothetical protein C8Q76DRAFT_300502 [Earliella scabrosa]